MTARIRNTPKSIFPISIDNPATPVAPNKIAIIPNTKNASAALSIKNLQMLMLRMCKCILNANNLVD